MNSAVGLRSRLLSEAGFVHAFFTRHHGWSTGPYASLNLSPLVGDDEARVHENLKLVAESLGVPLARLLYAAQVHGNDVAVVGNETDAAALRRHPADAVVSVAAGVACAVRTADCVPLLVADRASGAVAAIHAGWRGVAAGVVAAAISRMRREIGATGDLIVAIGPHISVAAFEVSEEVAEQLCRASPVPDVVQRGAGRPHVDLERILRGQLDQLGVVPAAVERVGGCTVADPDRWFSYRRDGKGSGRHLHAIVGQTRPGA